MLGLSTGGDRIGTVIGLAISGILCQSDFLGGWPSAFYVFGTFIIFSQYSTNLYFKSMYQSVI